jgi:LmbE family N-acetylglucosaminyl deacetylase
MTMNEKRVLVISAHADDDLMCAGTLFKLKDKGYKLFEIVLTDSSEGGSYKAEQSVGSKASGLKKASKEAIDTKQNALVREAELDDAAKYLGLEKLYKFKEPDLGLIYSKDLMLKVVQVIREVKPQIGIIMNQFDFHIDHREAAKIGSEAFKWAPTGVRPDLGEPVKTPIVLSAEGMIPIAANVLVDTSTYVDKKLELFKKYKSQASSKAVKFDRSLGFVRGYQLRKPGAVDIEKLSAEAFTTDPTSPLILFED